MPPGGTVRGTAAVSSRRDRIGLGCEPLRRYRHFRGPLAPGNPAQGPVAFQFGEEPVFECRSRSLVLRILEGHCPGLENYRAQFSRTAAEALLKAISPICSRGNAAWDCHHTAMAPLASQPAEKD